MLTERPVPPHQLRPATVSDTEFLWTLRQQVMKENVEQTWGKWDDAQQRRFFERGFIPKHTQIIVIDGREGGRIDLNRSAFETFLGVIELLPELQRQGIGSAIMRTLMEESRRAQLPIRLQVLKVNERARKLYLRLGFVGTGETTTHHLMLYLPPASDA